MKYIVQLPLRTLMFVVTNYKLCIISDFMWNSFLLIYSFILILVTAALWVNLLLQNKIFMIIYLNWGILLQLSKKLYWFCSLLSYLLISGKVWLVTDEELWQLASMCLYYFKVRSEHSVLICSLQIEKKYRWSSEPANSLSTVNLKSTQHSKSII